MDGYQKHLLAEIDRLNGELIKVKLSCPDCNEIRAAWQSDIAERDAELEAANQRAEWCNKLYDGREDYLNKVNAELAAAKERIKELEKAAKRLLEWNEVSRREEMKDLLG